MYRTPEKQSVNIVLVGNFTPSIFQPAWFALNGLIRKTESDPILNPSNKVITLHGLSEFTLDWLKISVTTNRFVAETYQESHYETLRDLVIATFHLLEHTPISCLGINVDQQFRMNSEEEWHALGHALAPKDKFWTPILNNPGLQHLTIKAQRTDGCAGNINITVDPSMDITTGVRISVNNHFDFDINDAPCHKMLEILGQHWDETMFQATKSIQHVMDSAP